MEQSPVVVYFDGCCEPFNPKGWACWAWVALARDGTELAHGEGCLGHGDGMTNNRAEYAALIHALRWMQQQGLTGLRVRGDSQLVIRQVSGDWACNAPHLQPLHREAWELVRVLCPVLEWVPREKNERADGYSRQAYQDARRAARGL